MTDSKESIGYIHAHVDGTTDKGEVDEIAPSKGD